MRVAWVSLRTLSILGFLFAFATGVAAQTPGPVIEGKEGWLYLRYDVPLPELSGQVHRSVALIGKLQRILARTGVQLAVVVVPSKVDTHPEYLPDGFNVTPYMSTFHQGMRASLAAAGVEVIDIKQALRDAALKSPDAPMFFRVDTHWTPAGTLIAARAVADGLAARPGFKAALASIPRERFQLVWEKEPDSEMDHRDLVRWLPAGAADY